MGVTGISSTDSIHFQARNLCEPHLLPFHFVRAGEESAPAILLLCWLTKFPASLYCGISFM